MTAVKGAGEEIDTRSKMENFQQSGVHLSPNHHEPSVAPARSKYPHPPSPAETVTVKNLYTWMSHEYPDAYEAIQIHRYWWEKYVKEVYSL